MGYRINFRDETIPELESLRPKLRRMILDKLKKVAGNLPQSLNMKTVEPVRGSDRLGLPGRFFKLEVTSGYRAAFVLYDDTQLMTVYLVGNHDYAKKFYTKAAVQRLELP